MGRGLELALALDRVEGFAGVEDLDEQLPGFRALFRVKLADGEVRAKEDVFVVREGDLQLLGYR